MTHQTKARSRSRSRDPATRAARELMAGLGGIAIQGAPTKPFYHFAPAKRPHTGIPRCTHCVAAGSRAACLLQPLLPMPSGAWRALPCHACTVATPGEPCSLDTALFLVNDEDKCLVPAFQRGDLVVPATPGCELGNGETAPSANAAADTPSIVDPTAESVNAAAATGGPEIEVDADHSPRTTSAIPPLPAFGSLPPPSLVSDAADSAPTSPTEPTTPGLEPPLATVPSDKTDDETKSAPEPAYTVAHVLPYCH